VLVKRELEMRVNYIYMISFKGINHCQSKKHICMDSVNSWSKKRSIYVLNWEEVH
jgi:hypothetical protein